MNGNEMYDFMGLSLLQMLSRLALVPQDGILFDDVIVFESNDTVFESGTAKIHLFLDRRFVGSALELARTRWRMRRHKITLVR
jgi:hypothetical protein